MIEHVSTQEGYDRWSSIYDGEGNPLIALEEPVVDALLGEVRGLAIADVGCGTGRHALRLAARQARVTALDFSAGMLARAREKAAQFPELDVTFLQHDLLEPLPLADAAFDRVLCCLVLDHIPSPQALLAELARICRPGGSLILSVMHPALMLKGLQARFVDPESGREVRPQSVANQVSDYVMAASRCRLRFDHMSEHFADEALAQRCPRAEKYIGWPMLLAMRLVNAT